MLSFHPLANIFPMIDGAAFDALVADIKINGLRDKVVLLDGLILDGRNRYRAGLLAEVVPKDATGDCFRAFDAATDGDPLTFVLSKNLTRRHLNDDQRRMVAARLVSMGRGRPSDNPAECGIKVPEAARLVNTDRAGTERARTVQANGSLELQAAVDHGKLSVSSAAQAAKLPVELQRDIAQKAETGKANVVRTVIKQASRNAKEQALGQKQAALPDKKYGVILMDPEWQFQVWSRATGLDRSADNHYPTSDMRMLLMREIGKITAKDCMCAMWVTDLTNGVRLMESYGFQVKSRFIWVKDIIEGPRNAEGKRTYVEVGPAGTGYWARDRAEILLIGTRGDFPAPAPGTQGESVWFAARGEHSEKPENAYLWIEKHWPSLPKIELNARAARAGWDRWGNEAPPALAAENENQDRFPDKFNQDVAVEQPAPIPAETAMEIPPFLLREKPAAP